MGGLGFGSIEVVLMVVVIREGGICAGRIRSRDPSKSLFPIRGFRRMGVVFGRRMIDERGRF